MNYEEWLKWREEYFIMVRESDIFGGQQWTKEQQFADEMEALKYQMKYTIESYRRLKKGEWKKIQDFIDGIER
jgi:hypothetical protein